MGLKLIADWLSNGMIPPGDGSVYRRVLGRFRNSFSRETLIN